MRKIWFFILSSFLLLWSCVAPAPAEEPQPSNSELIWEFIDTQLPDSIMDLKCHHYIVDSIYIQSLQTTLYKVFPGITDTKEYILLHDEQSDQIYTIIFSYGITPYNRPLTDSLNLIILRNDESGHNIEPVDYSLLQLEVFLNRCIALQTQPLNYETLDTIFQFYFAERHFRIASSIELDSMAKKGMGRNLSLQTIYLEKMELLKRKLQEPGVLLYYFGYWKYFEIDNASEQICPSCAGDDEKSLFDHWYNLKVLQL